MIKNNRNNEQIYGRNDMIMLDPNNKIYGSLGLADRYVMKTEEGTKLALSNPKLGSFDDVLTEFNIYGMSKQESTTGANLIDIDSMLNECLVKNADDTYSILKTETNRFSKSFPVNLKAGTVVRFDADVIEYNGTYNHKLQCDFGFGTIAEGHTTTLREDITKVTIYQDSSNDVGTYTKFKNAILSVGKAKVPYEPYTGGKPSPSPEYPQEIKSVVNPTVKVTNEDGLKVQSVTFPYTLNAIPVSNGGNVTIKGQQYVADYVDVERGKVVRKINKLILTGEENWQMGFENWGTYPYAFRVEDLKNVLIGNAMNAKYSWYEKHANEQINSLNAPYNNCIVVSDSRFSTVDEFTNELKKQNSNGNPLIVYCVMITPQEEINLAPEVIEQYKKFNLKVPGRLS